jgi:hypothetical protein
MALHANPNVDDDADIMSPHAHMEAAGDADMEAAGDADMEVAGDADMEATVMETWWKPDANTLKWEAWAREEKMKEQMKMEEKMKEKRREDRLEMEEQKVKRKKERAMADEAAGGGRKVEGPLTKEAVGAQMWNFLNESLKRDQTDEERSKALQDMLSRTGSSWAR